MLGPGNENNLKAYLDFAGIAACNVNPYIPALSDIGSGWQELVSLIDSHETFLCKAYRKRIVYLSREVYFLLKQLRAPKVMDRNALIVYRHMEQLGAADINIIRQAVPDRKLFDSSFDFLLENLYITAYKNGKFINPNWSSLIYSTAGLWEKNSDIIDIQSDPAERLHLILSRTIPEKEIINLIG
jgi:hypothetical protein